MLFYLFITQNDIISSGGTDGMGELNEVKS